MVAMTTSHRIQCFRAGLRNANDTGAFVVSVSDPEMAKVYAVAYDPNGNLSLIF